MTDEEIAAEGARERARIARDGENIRRTQEALRCEAEWWLRNRRHLLTDEHVKLLLQICSEGVKRDLDNDRPA